MTNNYASYEDYLLSTYVSKLMNELEAGSEGFNKKFIRGEKGSFWHVNFKGSEFLVSVVPEKRE